MQNNDHNYALVTDSEPYITIDRKDKNQSRTMRTHFTHPEGQRSHNVGGGRTDDAWYNCEAPSVQIPPKYKKIQTQWVDTLQKMTFHKHTNKPKIVKIRL